MATQVRIKLNYDGIGEILRSQPVRDVLADKANNVVAAARASAPVGPPPTGGAHRDSIHVEEDTTDRAVARVVANSDHSSLVEARTGNLARALGSA